MEKLAKNIESLNRHRKCYVNPSLHSLNERYDKLERDLIDFKHQFYEDFGKEVHFKNEKGGVKTHKALSKFDKLKHDLLKDMRFMHDRIDFLLCKDIDIMKINIDKMKKDIEKIKNKKSLIKKILDFFIFK